MECIKCRTENGYIRIEKKEWVCRKCGTITVITAPNPIKDEVKENVV